MHKGEERNIAAETLCGYLFEHLKDIAEAFAGEAVARCVLAVPASFTLDQREALREVGKRAGLPFSMVISDPVAVAIAYGLDRTDAEMEGGACGREGGLSKPKSTIVVVDWGGGGVEATVLRRTDGALSVAGQAADPSVGGGVFTERLVKFCAKDFKRRTGGDIFESRRSLLKVTRGCEEAVRTLSASAQANVYIEAAHEGCDMNVKISRTRFEDLCFDLYKAASGVISKALAEAGSAPDKVDMVLLAGGIAQMPKVCSAVKANFPEGTTFGAGLVPDEAVAVGATIQAFLLQEHASFVAPGAPPLPREIRTCPATLGVRCSGRRLEGEDGDGADGHTTVVIAKGSLLPAQSTTTVKLVPTSPESTFGVEVVEIGVGQAQDGKEGRVPVARLLGTLDFEGVVGDEPGKVLEVKVGCTLRSEGVLKVEAVATESGAKRELLIGHEGNS